MWIIIRISNSCGRGDIGHTACNVHSARSKIVSRKRRKVEWMSRNAKHYE